MSLNFELFFLVGVFLETLNTFAHYFSLNAEAINSSKTFRSISSSLLIYRQPVPVLCLPNFFRVEACSFMLKTRCNDRFALRGEKPILNQSTSRPELGLLYLFFPNPIIELPHILGSSLLTFCIVLTSKKLSLRCCSSFKLLMKSSTWIFCPKVYHCSEPMFTTDSEAMFTTDS